MKDYTGTDPDRPRLFARVYKSNRTASDEPWFWTVSDGNQQIASGHAAEPKDAEAEAEEAYRWLIEDQ